MFSNLNKLFLNFSEPNRKRIVDRKKSSSLSFTTLEDRNMLATIVFDAGAGEVTIFGTTGNDSVFVNNVGSNGISVSASGAQTQQFDITNVNEITFFGGAGDDLFENNTSVNSFFGAQDGNDTFRGGSGNDTVFGGAGVDNLQGNGGDDLLQGCLLYTSPSPRDS